MGDSLEEQIRKASAMLGQRPLKEVYVEAVRNTVAVLDEAMPLGDAGLRQIVFYELLRRYLDTAWQESHPAIFPVAVSAPGMHKVVLGPPKPTWEYMEVWRDTTAGPWRCQHNKPGEAVGMETRDEWPPVALDLLALLWEGEWRVMASRLEPLKERFFLVRAVWKETEG